MSANNEPSGSRLPEQTDAPHRRPSTADEAVASLARRPSEASAAHSSSADAYQYTTDLDDAPSNTGHPSPEERRRPRTTEWSSLPPQLQSPQLSWQRSTGSYQSRPTISSPHGERADPFASSSYSPSLGRSLCPSESASRNMVNMTRTGSQRRFGGESVGHSSSMSPSQSGTSLSTRRRHFFQSHVLQQGEEVYKPWLESKTRKKADRRAYWIFVATCILGFLASLGVIYTGVASLPKYKYCLVMQDDFSGTELNTNVWFREQQVGGFGTGEFEWTTDSTNNSYVKDGSLYIVPTLTSDALGEAAITNGYTLNLTSSGKCTAANVSDPVACSVASNITTGVVLPPVQSARLITNFSTTIRYGRVEVRAKMPTGSWIWPAVWMMPKDSVYGAWPRSGEIDIFESKGNLVTRKNDDYSNRMRSSLHWGVDVPTDRYLETTENRQLYRKYYDQEFHTFGLEWTPEGIYTWEQSPIHKVLAYNWATDFYTKGTFPLASANGTALDNPWPKKSKGAPFDQDFFLILSVAVGGTNGYFTDDADDDKPWSNKAANPRADFWKAKDKWLSTWPERAEDRAMVVDSVKIWQLDGPEGKGCPASPVIA